MKPLWKNLAVIVVAFGLGVAGYALFGASPDKLVPESPGDVEWKPVQAWAPDLAAADQRWKELAPWGAAPKPAEPLPPPPPIPPMAVGIAKGARGPEAIFMLDGAGEVRLPPGGRLPGGGRVLRISGLNVTWLDAKGVKQEREMFAVFRPTASASAMPASGSSATAGTPASMPQASIQPPVSQPQPSGASPQRAIFSAQPARTGLTRPTRPDRPARTDRPPPPSQPR